MDHLLSKEKEVGRTPTVNKKKLVYKSYIVLRDLIVSQTKRSLKSR